MDTVRGSWWLVTINNPTELDRQTFTNPPPRWLRLAKGQDEIGENGTLHIQAALNTQQVRMSQVKQWLPRAHIELARNANAVANYVSKDRTAVPDTQFEYNHVDNGNGALTMAQVMMMLAEYAFTNSQITALSNKTNANGLPVYRIAEEIYKVEYWDAVGMMLTQNENLVALLTQPQYERAWVKTRKVWLIKLEQDRQTNVSVAYETPRNEIVQL